MALFSVTKLPIQRRYLHCTREAGGSDTPGDGGKLQSSKSAVSDSLWNRMYC
jgi:hypothetical protein